MKAKEAASQVFLEEKCCHPYFVDNMCIMLRLLVSLYLLNLILRKSTICLENIDSNKIRGEGVYNDPAPLRSAGSYFYILQLFSTEPDGCCAHCVVHILISGQSGWRRSRETVASSKYHWTAIAQLLHGGWPVSHCDVGNSLSHVAPAPIFPHQNQLKEKLLLFLKRKEWLFVFSSLNGEISTGRMCRKFTGCQISSLP